MKECAIEKADSGQRLDKYLKKYLKEATGGFIYKMLRKKNIKLNGKKADGKELLKEGDVVTLYLSDETLAKFRGRNQNKKYPVIPLEIIYEDEDTYRQRENGSRTAFLHRGCATGWTETPVVW